MPILMTSAARAVMTKGDAICATPAATAVLMTVRRLMRLENKSDAIGILPSSFSKRDFLEGNHAIAASNECRPRVCPIPGTLRCGNDQKQGSTNFPVHFFANARWGTAHALEKPPINFRLRRNI